MPRAKADCNFNLEERILWLNPIEVFPAIHAEAVPAVLVAAAPAAGPGAPGPVARQKAPSRRWMRAAVRN
jgi:hypothetical protein